MGAPAATELLAACGKLANEVVQFLVVRVPAGFGPQYCDGGVGRGVPIGVEAPRVRVEKGVAGEVRGARQVAIVDV
jgi:hypothetical protein